MQAHKVRGDGGIAAGAPAEHDRAAYLLRRHTLLLGQQRQCALKRGKIDFARSLPAFQQAFNDVLRRHTVVEPVT